MYRYTGFGNTFTGNELGLPVGIVSSNGVLTFDGNGHWSIREAELINGAVVATDAQLAGELTFLSDCTFAANMQGQPIFVGVVVDRRQADPRDGDRSGRAGQLHLDLQNPFGGRLAVTDSGSALRESPRARSAAREVSADRRRGFLWVC